MQTIKSWVSVVFSAAIIGTLARFVFFILLAPQELLTISSNTPYLEILKAFFLGFRFDLSAICYLTLVFWLISIFIPKKPALIIWKVLLVFWSFLLIIDIGYYSFYNDRINILIFGIIEDDTWALIKTFWKNYPVLWILFFTFLLASFFKWTINNYFPVSSKNPQRISSLRTRLFVLILLLIGARGTFSLFPLGDHDTVISHVPFLNTLSYGTAHSFSRAIRLKREQFKMGSSKWNANLKEFGYLNHEDEAFQDYFQKKIKPHENRYTLMKMQTSMNLHFEKRPHAVLVVMESWGYYGLQFQNPEFDLVGNMKKYFQNDFLNFHFLSTTPATTGSLSCILSGLPQRTISPFLTESDYLQTSFSTSPAKTYKKKGYTTRFIYGGNPGWRDINKFAFAQGFDTVAGEVDIEQKLKEYHLDLSGKHDWGLFDQDLFKYAELILKEATTPQLLVLMTTTNHPPFTLPINAKTPTLNLDFFSEKNLLLDTNLARKRFMTFRYSSDALAHFFDAIKNNADLESKTVLAATADHTFWIKNFSNTETFMKSAVPFFISLPANLKKQISENQRQSFLSSFGGHQDIWPSLYEVSLPSSDYESFGHSLWLNSETSFALNYERLIFSKDRGAYVINAQQLSSLQAEKGLSFLSVNVTTDLDQQLAQKYRALMGALDSYLYHSKMTP